MESPHLAATLTQPQLIETMRLEKGAIALWPLHRARLVASARALGYALDLNALEQRLAAELSAQRNAPAQRLRLLLAADGTLSLTTAPLPDTAEPVRIALACDVLSADDARGAPPADRCWLRHKTTHRPWFDVAQQWLAAQSDVFDLIFVNADGHVCEGSRCNIYVADGDGGWRTPPLADGVLPGVQRRALIAGGQVRETPLTLEDFRHAPRWRVSNALRGWLEARPDAP